MSETFRITFLGTSAAVPTTRRNVSATLVAYARIHHQAHFLSDVTAGALIGTVTGLAVVHRNEDARHRFAFAPLLGPDGHPGVGVAFSF